MKEEKLPPKASPTIAESLSELSRYGRPVTVSLSNDLIHLLSNQLYNSPVKAIEELVVNSFDADANNCCLFVPVSSDFADDFVIVFDDGIGMSHEGLEDLWQIGHSPKGRDEELTVRFKRKQIGKFGIGKLAARTIADKLTYITKQNSKILAVSVDFNEFRSPDKSAKDDLENHKLIEGSNENGNKIKNIQSSVYEITDLRSFFSLTSFHAKLGNAIHSSAAASLGEETENEDVDLIALLTNLGSWTIAILEKLTPKSKTIRHSTLKWVLSTAMPLASDFKLFLNDSNIESGKEEYEKVVEFNLIDLPVSRLENLKTSTDQEWQKKDNRLVSTAFPAGISGEVFVTKESLAGKKSDDLMRSHGFFIRVRERLIDYKDPLFGIKDALYFGTFVRFHARIYVDDLDQELKASRDAFEETDLLDILRKVLREIFNEADSLYNKWLNSNKGGSSNKEGERNQVQPKLVEYPIADVLVSSSNSLTGSEADESWFYLEFLAEADIGQLLKDLYEPNRSKKYKYEYREGKETDRMVKFDPSSGTFFLNKKHQFVREYFDGNKRLLQDIVTAEALLEVYLRLNDVSLNSIFEILEKRDELLRSLAEDSSYSFATIAERLRNASAHQHELEISLVVAARALGFNAKHISGSGTPDGVASFDRYGIGRKKITLEAKSSNKTPGLPQIDFAGLDDHVKNENEFEEIYFGEIEKFGPDYKGEGIFDGCLLVAPKYPGQTLGENAVARRAQNLRVSCWTIEQLARVVEASEKKKINAEKILNIVLTKFAPADVSEAIDALLSVPQWDYPELYQAIFNVIEQQINFFSNLQAITVDGVISALASLGNDRFRNLSKEDILTALRDMAGASQDGMNLEGEYVVILVHLDELQRKLENLLKGTAKPRRLSSFRDD
jgi:prophage maintenance system killer protein